MADTKNKKFDFTSLNTLAVVSIASALTSIGAVAAIITGHVALTQIKKSGESGRGLALAGTIIGYVTIALWIALWILGSIAFAVAGAYLRGNYGMDGMGMHRMGWND
jgi:peptidyl-prolyl cis-trans isomerase B (cyclophilin B)